MEPPSVSKVTPTLTVCTNTDSFQFCSILLYAFLVTALCTGALASLRNSSLSSLLIQWTTFLAHRRKCHWHEMVRCHISSPSTFPTTFLFAPFSSAMIILGFRVYCGSFFTSRKMSRKFWRNIVTFSVSSVRHSTEANLCVFSIMGFSTRNVRVI